MYSEYLYVISQLTIIKKITRSTDIHIVFGVLSRKIINFIFNELYLFSILSIKLLLHNFMNNHMHTVSFDN
jgi:hypothetical protein